MQQIGRKEDKNKSKEVIKQILVSLFGLMQSNGDNMKKRRVLKENWRDIMRKMCRCSREIFSWVLGTAWDKEACVRKASRRPWVLVQSRTQRGFPALKEVVGRRRRRDTPLEHYKHCLLTTKKPPLVLTCCEAKIAIKLKWKQMDK